jgi:hypothetical protein
MRVIEKIIASIRKLHGDQREQAAKHREYLEWLERRGQRVCVRSIMPTVPYRESAGDR